MDCMRCDCWLEKRQGTDIDFLKRVDKLKKVVHFFFDSSPPKNSYKESAYANFQVGFVGLSSKKQSDGSKFVVRTNSRFGFFCSGLC